MFLGNALATVSKEGPARIVPVVDACCGLGAAS
jgi:hypothetical protein